MREMEEARKVTEWGQSERAFWRGGGGRGEGGGGGGRGKCDV